MDVLEFKNILWDYTRKISENMNRTFNPLCEQYGLTMLQARILVELSQHESHTIGSLANSIHMAGANISTMCKKLEMKGFLKRVRNPNDERVVKLVLTEMGHHTVSDFDNILMDRILHYLKNEKTQTLDEIINGLQKMNELLQKMGTVEKK